MRPARSVLVGGTLAELLQRVPENLNEITELDSLDAQLVASDFAETTHFNNNHPMSKARTATSHQPVASRLLSEVAAEEETLIKVLEPDSAMH